jgi:tetratricopeptide (TPR) repeat protein
LTTGTNGTGAPGDGVADDPLVGWKAIAAYLARDIRTVQRWEATEHLPVHRLEHQRQGSAYAYRSELDEWRARRSKSPSEPAPPIPSALPTPSAPPVQPRPAGRQRLVWVLGGLALVATTIVALALMARSGRPAANATGGDTDNAQAYAAYAEGRAFYAVRQYHDAATSLERAVARDPKYGSAWALLAKTYGRLAQPVWAGGTDASKRAAEAARRAEQFAPKHADTHVALALAARARSDVATWRAEAQRAIDLDPRAAEAYALLGDSYSSVVYACNRDQDAERAESYYRKALELRPDLTTAISNRAGNLRRMGRYAECIAVLDKAVRLFPDQAPLRATRGGCKLMEGDMVGGAEDIESLRGNPRIAPTGALVYFGLLELKRGDTAQGVRDLEEFIAADHSARSDLIVAEVYGITGQTARAATHLEKAFAKDPSCAAMVDSSLAFKPIRETPEVKKLLGAYRIH